MNAAIAMRDFMLASFADILWGQPALANVAGRKLIRLAGFSDAGYGVVPLVGEVERFVCRR